MHTSINNKQSKYILNITETALRIAASTIAANPPLPRCQQVQTVLALALNPNRSQHQHSKHPLHLHLSASTEQSRDSARATRNSRTLSLNVPDRPPPAPNDLVTLTCTSRNPRDGVLNNWQRWPMCGTSFLHYHCGALCNSAPAWTY